MNSNEIRNILKKDCKYFEMNKKGNFIRVICDYLHINQFAISHPSYIHIVEDEDYSFIVIEEVFRIDLKDIKELFIC